MLASLTPDRSAPDGGGQSLEFIGRVVRGRRPAALPPNPGRHLVDEFVTRSQCGDTEAFAELYRHFRPTVRAQVARQLRADDDGVEDVVADVFLIAWRRLPSYRPQAPFPAWLAGIARLEILKRWRARQLADIPVDTEAFADIPHPQRDTADIAIDRLEAARVWAAIAALPPTMRRVLALRLEHDLSVAEMAAATGATEYAVRAALCRGLHRVRERLGLFRDAEAEQEAMRRHAARTVSPAQTLGLGYQRDLAHFSAWCTAHDVEALPASPQTLLRYSAAQLEAGRTPGTVRHRLRAIARHHEAAGLAETPTAHPDVRALVADLYRAEHQACRQRLVATAA